MLVAVPQFQSDAAGDRFIEIANLNQNAVEFDVRPSQKLAFELIAERRLHHIRMILADDWNVLDACIGMVVPENRTVVPRYLCIKATRMENADQQARARASRSCNE